MKETVTKSRNLSLADFYTILQQEYISYFIRSKIYPTEYANKYTTYCECKKEKIDKISIKNNLPSIFNSESIRNRYIDEFINAYGIPNFQYRDDTSLRIMGHWDKEYWFSIGTSIKVKFENEISLTTVVRNFTGETSVVATINGETRKFEYSYISRVITDNLISF